MELNTKIPEQLRAARAAVKQTAHAKPVCEDVVFNGPGVESIWNGYGVRDTEHLTALHRFWRSDHPGHLQTWTRDIHHHSQRERGGPRET